MFRAVFSLSRRALVAVKWTSSPLSFLLYSTALVFHSKALGFFCLVSSYPVKVRSRSLPSFLFQLVKRPVCELWAGFGKTSFTFLSVLICDPLITRAQHLRGYSFYDWKSPSLTCKIQMEELPFELPVDQSQIKGGWTYPHGCVWANAHFIK